MIRNELFNKLTLLTLIILTLFVFEKKANSASISKLTLQKNAVERLLKSEISFDKKRKVIVSFKNWADKELLSSSDKLSEEDLTQVMQFSNLLNSLNPNKLTSKNCNSASTFILDEDRTPLSDKPSTAAQAIVSWLRLICKKGK